MSAVPVPSSLHRRLESMAAASRIVAFAGLPGVGKSYLVQQLAILAHGLGRRLHLLQWDVARTAFETPTMLERYPETNGFTHTMITKAVGLWARGAVMDWHQRHPGAEHLLVAECPIVGGRLAELAGRADDTTEAVLSGSGTTFVLPVPSRAVRAAIERRRAQTIAAPTHARESFDAPPNVVEALWESVMRDSGREGAVLVPPQGPIPYDPDAYRAIYLHWLRHRRVEVLEIDEEIASPHSVYEVAGVESALRATPDEVRMIQERLYTLA